MSGWRGMAAFLVVCAALVILVVVGVPYFDRGLALTVLLVILVLLCCIPMFWMMRNRRDGDRSGPRQNGQDR